MEVLAAEQIPSLGKSAFTRISSIKTSARSCTVPVYITDASNSNTVWTGPNTTAVYDKGGMIVSMLRTLAGDTKFFEATKNYVAALSYASADTDNLRQHFQTALAGADLSGFFADWVHGVGTPSYNVEWNNVGTKVTLKLTQTRSSNSNVTYFRMPVVIKVKDAAGTAQNVVLYDNGGDLSIAGNGTISAGTGTNKITITLPFVPTTVQFDPDNVTIATGTVAFNGALAKISTQKAAIKVGSINDFKTLIYPNPSTSAFTLNVNSPDQTSAVTMDGVDVLGRIIEHSENVTLGQNVSFGGNLSAGFYIVHLIQGAEQRSSKIVKQ